ncbi:MAG: PEP-CTERM sorting domain-containing protein [Rubrivivax sp.]|nr:MAG: PEP-CTERM sorting domain-containing protein [Rubrivivax sp.]
MTSLPLRRLLPHQPCAYKLALAMAPLFGAFSVHGATMEPVSQSRSVQMLGDLNAFNYETQESSWADFNDGAQSLPDGWDPLRLGMDISIPDGNCFGQGMASQTLVAGTKSIEFTGLADVNVAGIESFPYQLEGSGSAYVDIEYSFRIDAAQSVVLAMDSSIGNFREDDFIFAFKSASGDYIWADTAVVNERGDVERSFSRQFLLQPGQYTLSAHLTAFSAMSAATSFSGRTWAQFSVSAVPEPATAWMVLAGGGVFWAARKRRPTLA